MMNSSRCAACKHLRRRCPSDCIFSPYFPSNNPQRFAYVHKIYGASNIGKMLQELPVNRRAEAADSLYFEAYSRVKDPVYGCVGKITLLYQQIKDVECELARIQAEIAFLRAQAQDDIMQNQQVGFASSFDANFLPDQKGFSTSSFYPSTSWS